MFVDMMFPTWPVEVTRVLAENDKMHSFLPQKSILTVHFASPTIVL